MGIDSDDYSRLILEDLLNIEAWSGIGAAYHGIPNRISYHLDLMRFSTAVDAACASSLIAVHLGRQAVLSGELDVAINTRFAKGVTDKSALSGRVVPSDVKKDVIWVFSGHGAQLVSAMYFAEAH
jgi:6-methylsalicylic acid synthase